jgi:hypothetical protein
MLSHSPSHLLSQHPVAPSNKREQKILQWISVGLLVFVSAFIWAPSRDGLEAIYALAFFIPMLLLLCGRKPQLAQYGGHITLLALVYAGYAALTSAWSVTPQVGFFVLQWLVLATWLCGVSWLAYWGRLELPRLLKLLVWVGAMSSLLTLLWFYSKHPLLTRLEGISLNRNANNIGSVFGIVALLAYIQWLQAKGRANSFIAFGLFAVISLSLLAAQSRANFLAFALLAPIACYLAKPSALKLWLQLGLLLLGAVVFSVYAATLEGVLFERGVSLRDAIWSDLWQRIQTGSWLWGTGLEKEGRILVANLGEFNHAHNAWLDTLYRTGLVGLLLNIAYVVALYRPLFRSSRAQFSELCSELCSELWPLYLWLSYGVIYCCFDARGFFWQLDPKWFCLWIPAGLIVACLTASKRAESLGAQTSAVEN